MSDSQPPPSSNSSGKSPSHYVYHVRDINGQKGFWTRIGAAWAHADGNGFNLLVEWVPLDGRLTIRIVGAK